MSARKLLFLATEDWFVRSHFLPLVERAREDGLEAIVAARSSGADVGGARVIDMPFARGSLRLEDLQREVSAVGALLRKERPDIVHAIALKPIAQLLFAGAPGAARAFAVTGRGYLAASESVPSRAISAVLSRRIRGAVAQERSLLLVENNEDRRWVESGRALPDERVVLMPGAGVDADALPSLPEPHEPVVVGIAARLVRSKGIDIAVDAVRRLQASGLDIRLNIAGAVDPDNPEQVSQNDVARWRQTPGVSLLGHVTDITAFWADAHIACLASRGGEGLPRTLLESAAFGRPIVTTDVPGCADFVGADAGIVVLRDDAAALADALQKLAQDGALRRRMGAAARARVLAGYTTRHAADCASEAWRRLLATNRSGR